MSYYESKSFILYFLFKLVLYYCGLDVNIKEIIFCKKKILIWINIYIINIE